MNQQISEACRQTVALHEKFCQEQNEQMVALAKRLGGLFAEEGQLLLAGHGHMAAIAQLMAAQFAFRLAFDRPVLPALCLGSDPLLSARMMAEGQFEQHLVRHYRAVNSQHHLLLVCSDGSAAPELQALVEETLENEQTVVLLSGDCRKDPLFKDDLDVCIDLATDSMPRLLELAQFAGHLLCELVEKELFGR